MEAIEIGWSARLSAISAPFIAFPDLFPSACANPDGGTLPSATRHTDVPWVDVGHVMSGTSMFGMSMCPGTLMFVMSWSPKSPMSKRGAF
jgi:hypothetical protein